VLNEYIVLWQRMQLVQLVPGVPDTFSWRFTTDGVYSAASAYGAMFLGASTPLGAKEVWKTPAPAKVRLFFWLVMHHRCWTSDRCFRHGLRDSPTCIFCDQLPETMDHILLGCVFSRETWQRILVRFHLQEVVHVQEEDFMSWWLRSRRLVDKQRRRGFDSLVFLVGWRLWKERNSRTFALKSLPVAGLVSAILNEAEDWCLAGFRSVRELA